MSMVTFLLVVIVLILGALTLFIRSYMVEKGKNLATRDGYRAMAADKEREAEALEWCNVLAKDLADEAG